MSENAHQRASESTLDAYRQRLIDLDRGETMGDHFELKDIIEEQG
jgi:hypothetical protein